MDSASRRAEVRKLWFQRFPDESQRTGNQVLLFHMWLQEHHPELLPRVKGGADTYQALKSDLHGFWKD